jgi:hypothetical protein
MIAFNHNLLALYRQAIEYFAQIAGQFCRGYRFHDESVISDLFRLCDGNDASIRVQRERAAALRSH